MTISVHQGDLPANVTFTGAVAVDCEMMGLNTLRDRLCLVQLSSGDGSAHLVQIAQGQSSAPNLKRVLEDQKTIKIFHFARSDLATLKQWLNIDCGPVYCTKTASRLCRTFTDRHGLKDVVRDLLGIEVSKQQQTTDWGAPGLTDEQKEYAASDVLHLHKVMDLLTVMLVREGRMELAQACFDFLPTRAALDIAGWDDLDIFAH